MLLLMYWLDSQSIRPEPVGERADHGFSLELCRLQWQHYWHSVCRTFHRMGNWCMHVYGAPDMVIEILSPSTRKKDMGLKLKKYITARVREYWMVDPDKKKVVVYDLEHNELPAIYGFEDQVPVKIFAGKCQIDFSEIYSYIEFLFEKE